MDNTQDPVDDVSQWSFPDLEMIETHKDISAIFIDENHGQRTNDSVETVSEEPAPVIDEVTQKQNELDELKNDFANKILLLNEMIEKIQGSMTLIDDELISIFDGIIKQVVKKMIFKEINTDPQVLLKIIDELKKLIRQPQGLITVQISQSDYQRLDPEKNSLPETITVGDSLTEGDIVIKSNSSEIRAILTERVDLVMRDQHE